MWWLIFVAIPGGVLAYFSGRLLERLYQHLKPVAWTRTSLPPERGEETQGVAGFSTLAVAVGVLALLAATLSRFSGGQFIALAAAFLAGWGTWALMVRSYWAYLLPGHPFRLDLDAAAAKMGKKIEKVRLRQGGSVIPRFFPDGSIEIGVRMLSDFTPAEQKFLIYAALHRHQNREVWKTWKEVGLMIASWAILLLSYWGFSHSLVGFTKDAADFFVPVFGIASVIVMGVIRWERYTTFSQEALQFALEETGDFAAASVIRQVDARNAANRLEKLWLWWQARQVSASAASLGTSTTIAPSNTQVQALGRKP